TLLVVKGRRLPNDQLARDRHRITGYGWYLVGPPFRQFFLASAFAPALRRNTSAGPGRRRRAAATADQCPPGNPGVVLPGALVPFAVRGYSQPEGRNQRENSGAPSRRGVFDSPAPARQK